MTLDNKTRASKIKLIYMAVPLVIVVATGTIYLAGNVRNLTYLIIAAVLFGFYFFAMAVFKFNYISFYAGPDKIRLRYKSLSPFSGDNNSIQIPLNQFHGFQFKTTVFGLKKSLVLMQKSPGGIARYAGVSLSSLSKPEIDEVLKALELVKALAKQKN